MASGEQMWGWVPPEAPDATLGCLMEPGSLTERLIASGKGFAVEPLLLGIGAAHPDEAAPIGIEAGETLMTIDVNGASKAADGKPATDGNTETKTEGGAK